MKQVLSILATAFIVVLPLLNFSVITHTHPSQAAALHQSGSLIAIPMRELYGMTTDFDVAVGGSLYQYAFTLQCTGGSSTTVTISIDNSSFQMQSSSTIACGSVYWLSATFSPTQGGLTTGNVTLTSELGTVTIQLIGNGVPVEHPYHWIEDLEPGTEALRLMYDGQRSLIYLTDHAMDRVIVFSPASRAQIASIPVGLDPMGLAISPDYERLYVANSGELSISVIDLNTLTELEKISTPSLGPVPEYVYTPYDIAVVSDTLALLGGDPPGLASGGPVYQLDLQTRTVSPRSDLGHSSHPVFRTSRDFSTVGIVMEPGSSPSFISRYDVATGSSKIAGYEIDCSLALNNDGTRLITTFCDCNAIYPNLSLLDQNLSLLTKIQVVGCHSAGAAFHPEDPKYAYTIEGQYQGVVSEVDIASMRQTRMLKYPIPTNYWPAMDALVISDDGYWAYAILKTHESGWPFKLLAVNLDPGIFDHATYLPIIRKDH